MNLPPLYDDNADESAALGLLIMGALLAIIVLASLLEYYTKRPNFVMRWLNHLAK